MEPKKVFLAFCLALCISSSMPLPTVSTTTPTHSLVVSSTEKPKEESNDTGNASKEDAVPIVPKIYEMRVDTNVSNRFAKTAVVSKVKNLAKTAQEATFSVVLPETAYISGFVMEIDGKSYEAYVKEKEEAKQIYTEAINRGQAAAHVEANARDSNRFTVSVNVEPQSKAVFTLTYEELLQRQNEQYEIVINIHPGQPVKELNVQVNVNESRPLKFVKSPPLRSGNEIAKNDEKLESLADIDIINSTSATVKFNPNIERQKQLANGLGTKEENGLAGQFVVQYDVERDPQGGEVLVKDGYFVHFFAPSDLPPLPKQVIFVLDTSGSMDGIRIRQLKEAMNSILTELKKEDVFNIVEFGSTVKVWNVENVQVQYEEGDDPWPMYNNPEAPQFNKTGQQLPGAFEANEENVEKAKKVVEKLNAYGGTDIKAGLEIALKLIKKNKDEKHQPIIVFLTDGEPTVGETNPDKIISTIAELNSGPARSPLFSLSFGDGADRDFLQKISLKNLGFARHIYEAADASLQLQEFYKQISSPLLSDVHFNYVSKVSKLTKQIFPLYFHGSELVVAGAIDEDFVSPKVIGHGFLGPIELVPRVENPVGELERLWAYLTVKQILEARDAAENKTLYTKKALDIALKYSFVTSVSSLVVVKPNDTRPVDTQDASKPGFLPDYLQHGVPLSFAGAGGIRQPPTLSLGSAAAFGGGAPVPAYASFLPPPNQQSSKYGGYSSAAGTILNQKNDYDIVEDSEDFVAFPSTPAPFPRTTGIFASTTTIPPTLVSQPDLYTDLKGKLPWLNDILTENGTLKISTGNYKLSTNETVDIKPECPKSPINGTSGLCTLLPQCPQAFSYLTDAQVFEKYFCPLDIYVGVCCPVEETTA